MKTKHHIIKVNGLSIFYRESGKQNKETLLLLHGFPSSSHMYRDILEILANDYHVIAPDYPGFGFSEAPSVSEFEYSFDNITTIMNQFIDELNLKSFYLFVQDYGGPIGFRIATARPKLIKGLIIQNANAYKEGLGEWAMKIGGYQQNNDLEGLNNFKDYLMSLDGLKEQYLNDLDHPADIDPIGYLTDNAFLNRNGAKEIQTALFFNYGTNFPKYPEWQNYFKEHQPKTLIIWGEKDKFFSKAGGEAYGKDLNNITFHFYDGGHFLLDEYANDVAQNIKKFIN